MQIKSFVDLISLCFLASAFVLGGCSKAPEPAPTPIARSDSKVVTTNTVWFKEVANESGIQFRHTSGHHERFYMPEIKSGGIGLLDFDRDGWLDVLCVNGGSVDPSNTNRPGPRLYRNRGNWQFEDVTERSRLSNHGEFGVGCTCADFDGDGWPDIYFNNLGRNTLLKNLHDGTYEDVTEKAGVGDPSWSVSSAFFDYDNDGHLDLIVVNYVHWSIAAELQCFSYGGSPDYCSPLNYRAPSMTTLYHNRGDGTFENVTQRAGLDKAYGNGLGVACADFNGDGRCDIFVANDAVPNQLWINLGSGIFKDEALIRGCAANAMGVSRAGMGVAIGDFDGNGWLDLFVTHLVGEGNGLFLNDKGLFTDVVRPKGPNANSLSRTGFGTGFFDFDNDGNLDVFVANGRVKRAADNWDKNDPYAEPNTLMRGLGDLKFSEIEPFGGTEPVLIATSRGCAFGDLDNDGGVDVVILNRDGPVHALRNWVSHRGHWILCQVLNEDGTESIGATVRIEAGGHVYYRQVLPNQSYASSNDPRIHCGIGSADRVDRLLVRWPSGNAETFGPFNANSLHVLQAGKGQKANP